MFINKLFKIIIVCCLTLIVFSPKLAYGTAYCYGGKTVTYSAPLCQGNSTLGYYCTYSSHTVYTNCQWDAMASYLNYPASHCIWGANIGDPICIITATSCSNGNEWEEGTDGCSTCYTYCSSTRCGTVSDGCFGNCTCRECQTEATCGTTDWDCKDDTCNECATEADCGWTDWDCSSDTCNECEDCSPACGQAKQCSGTCADTDNGVRDVPGLVSPLGTAADPENVYSINVPLDWTAETGAELYQARVLDTNGTRVWISEKISATEVTSGTLEWGETYGWQARSINTTCDEDISAWSGSQYFMTDYVPTLESITVKNSSGTVVDPDDNPPRNNNICQEGFYYDSNPRRVIVEAAIKDTDPEPDGVKEATLWWNGNAYPLSLGPRVGDVWIGTVAIDYPVSLGSVGPYDWEVVATDLYVTSPPRDSDRGWKIWNCEIPVTGTLFKATDAIQQCSTTTAGLGFFTPIDVGVSFSSIEFFNDPNRVALTRFSESSYGSPNNVIWSKYYLPLINGGDVSNPEGDLLATARVTRIIDLGSGTTSCPSSEFNLDDYISAYSANPRAQVDFSYIRDQEGWFQVVGGGVKGRNIVQSGVPVTAPLASRTLTISSVNNDNGLVSAANFEDNINGGCSECVFGRPNDWYVEQNTNDSDIYNYQYFYDTFLFKGGVGVTGSNWVGRPASGIYFVNGDLTIDENHQLASATETMMVVVRGGITIAQNVDRLDGIYVADGTIHTQGKSANQLVINGMLYSGGTMVLGRSFEDKTMNNTIPAVIVNYSPNLIFNLPGSLMKVLSGWREE